MVQFLGVIIGRVRDRIKAVLLADDGWTHVMIAKALFLDDQTVGNYINDYKESGKLSHESGGSTGKLKALQADELKNHLETTLYLHIHEICAYVLEKYNVSYTVAGMQSWMHNQGSYHKSVVTKEYADQSRIKLHYLPPYSPNLNPIERLWKIMHEHVSNNKFYPKGNDFVKAVQNFFDKTVHELKDVIQSRVTDNFEQLGTQFSF